MGQPSGTVVLDPGPDATDTIRYREITPSDFRGAAPPPEFADHARVVGAAFCGRIVLSPEARIVAYPVHPSQPGTPFVATMENMSFRAEMDRACSWWNQRSPATSMYQTLLQHEQIHFAISELAARRLTVQAQSWMTGWRHVAASADEAIAAGSSFVERALHELSADVTRRNEAFDRETSFMTNQQRQLYWFFQVRRELEQAEQEPGGGG
jgi:hypothetical protein